MNILAVGAHPDDIEFGCGGSLVKLADMGHKTHLLVLTNGANNGKAEIRREESKMAAKFLGADLVLLNEPDGALKADRCTIQVVETHLKDRHIDVVLVHAPDDSHQDHRAAAEIAIAAARHSVSILFYQSPSTLSFQPTVFVGIDNYVNEKVEALS